MTPLAQGPGCERAGPGWTALVECEFHPEPMLRPRKQAQPCQVPGCCEGLSRAYNVKKRLCITHIKAEAVQRRGHGEQLWRFCQQCGKLEPLARFEGTKRSCAVGLKKRRLLSAAAAALKPPSAGKHSPQLPEAAPGISRLLSATSCDSGPSPASTVEPVSSSTTSSTDTAAAALAAAARCACSGGAGQALERVSDAEVELWANYLVSCSDASEAPAWSTSFLSGPAAGSAACGDAELEALIEGALLEATAAGCGPASAATPAVPMACSLAVGGGVHCDAWMLALQQQCSELQCVVEGVSALIQHLMLPGDQTAAACAPPHALVAPAW